MYVTTLVWRTIYSKETIVSFQLGWKHDLQFAQWREFFSSRRWKGNIYCKLNGKLKINRLWRVLQSILSLNLNSLSLLVFPSLCHCSTEERLCLVKGIVSVWYIVQVCLVYFIVCNATLFKVFCMDDYWCCLCRLTYLLKGAGNLTKSIHTQKWIMFSYTQFDLKVHYF